MSTRTHLTAITSLDPIRDAVASNDDALAKAILARHADAIRAEAGDDEDIEEDEEFREYVESMILCPKPPREEPGAWNYVITLLAQHFQLDPDDNLPVNEGYKHYHVWEPYRALVNAHITPAAATSLKHLEDGRPLKGTAIDHDGCLFGWLTPAEVKELHRSLSTLDPTLITDEDLRDFHEALVESLAIISQRNAVLFLAAH